MQSSLFRSDGLTDSQAAEKQLMVTSCLLAVAGASFSAFSLWGSGSIAIIAVDLATAIVLVIQLFWIRNRNRFLIPPIWLLAMMAGVILSAIYLNGLMSVHWLYPIIVFSYFWLDIRKAALFSFIYTLLVFVVVVRQEGFNLTLNLRILAAGLVTMGLLHVLSRVRDNHIQKLMEGNSEYKNYAEILSGKIKSQVEEIRASEEKFHDLAEAIRDAVFMIDGEGRLTDWNPAAELMSGYRREEILGRHFLDVLAPSRYRAAFDKDFAAFRAAGTDRPAHKLLEWTVVRKDGSEFPISLSLSVLRLNQPWGAVGIARNVTERQLVEAARAQLAAIVESSVVAIFGEDLNGRVTSWNLGAQNIYGYSAAEMIGQAAAVLVPADRQQEMLNLLEKIKRGEEVPRFETSRLRKDRSLIDVSLALSPIRNERAYLVGISTVGHDISEIKNAERALKAVNRTLITRASCNLALIHAANEMALMEAMCRVLVDMGGYRFAWVGFAQHDEDKTVQLMAQYGYEKGCLDGVQLSWADTEPGRSPWGTAIRTGEPQIYQYVAGDPTTPPWHDELLKHGYRSIIALPLRHSIEKMGALTIYATDPAAFHAEEVSLLTELAEDLSYGITALRTHVAQEKSLERLQKSMVSTVSAVASMVEMRDPYTTGHQRQVAELAVAIGRAMGLPEKQVYGLHLAGIVHDLGKIHIPAEILSKPGKLTKIEYEMIKGHTESGYEILKNIDFLWPIAQTVLQHHERIDGSGYPAGLKGDQILLEAKIIAVADVVEAISSHRPYRPALGIDAALKELRDNRGKYYEPAVVDVCLRLFTENAFSFESKS